MATPTPHQSFDAAAIRQQTDIVELASRPRKCKKCSITKTEDDFYISKNLPRRFSSYCKPCEAIRNKEGRSGEKYLAKLARRRIKNKSAAAKKARAEYLSRPQVIKRIKSLQSAAYERRKKNPAYVISQRISVLVRRSIKTGKNNKSWRDFVDFSVDELRAHLEKQFTKGMTWENLGKWHIDHITPLSSFSFNSPTDKEFKLAWSLSNLRPLWATENQKKSALRIFLI